MPLRPEGTDGSDWSYREVVEDRYKRMAGNMSATFVLHQVQSALVFLKLGWYLVPVFVEGRRPEPFMYVLLFFLLLGNVCFYAGGPRGRCALPLMKTAALCVMATVGLHIIAVWKYHMLDPKTNHYSRRLYKVLRDQGSITSSSWLDAFTAAEAVLDAAVAAGTGLCFYTFNAWVRDAMEAAKQRQARTAKPAAAPSPSPPAGAARRRRQA